MLNAQTRTVAVKNPRTGQEIQRSVGPRGRALFAYGAACGNLRAAAPAIERAQRVVERQTDLLCVPAPRHPSRHGLPAVDFHAEALETQRARAIVVALGVVRTEAVARFALAAAGTQRPRRHAMCPLV